MIRALITGTLYEPPVARVGKSGKPFITAKLRADTAEGIAWCSLIAFGDQAKALKEQKANAAVAVSGRASLSAWLDKAGEPKAGLSVLVDQLATLRTRTKRKPEPAAAPGFDDDLPER